MKKKLEKADFQELSNFFVYMFFMIFLTTPMTFVSS